MRIYHQQIIRCAVFVCITSLILFAQVALQSAPNSVATPSEMQAGLTTATSVAIPPPASLAEAQATYRQTHAVKEEIKSYAMMAASFFNKDWYILCLEQCDQILQRWPEDKTLILFRVISLKSRCFAKLNRWEEAYENLDSFDQININNHQAYAPSIVPYHFTVHDSVLQEKTWLLKEQGKYHEAALTVEQRIDMRLHPKDDDIQAFMNLRPARVFMNVTLREEAAYLYCQAREYDTACEKYRAILTYMDQNINTDDTMIQSRYMLKHYYIIPLELASCQVQAGQYVDALKTYNAIETKLSNIDIRDSIFVTVSITNATETADVTYNVLATYNEAVAKYFMKIDLPLRRAECLIKARDKAQASQIISSIEILLKDEKFAQMAKVVSNEYAHEMINDHPLVPDIKLLLPVTIPALNKEIEELN